MNLLSSVACLYGFTQNEIFLSQTQITILGDVRVRSFPFYFAPFDVALNVSVFQVPNMLTKLSCVSITFITE